MTFGKSAIILTILFLHISLSASGQSNNYGQIAVKKWAGDRKSAFSFTFDDGAVSQYKNALPILDSFGFKGSFYVITGFITDTLPGLPHFLTWKELNTMALEGHEIGSHTVTHPYLTKIPQGDTATPGTLLYELYQSQKTINQRVPVQNCIMLAYPFTNYDSNVVSKTTLFYESARGGNGNNIQSDFSVTPNAYFSIGSKEEFFNLPRDSTPDDLDELQNFETYITNSISSGKWSSLMGHEVFPFFQIANMLKHGSEYPISSEWLTSLCQWLKSKSDYKEVWIETAGNITRYIKERQHFQYLVSVKTPVHLEINTSDNLNDAIYNYPLTADIIVPADWISAIVKQGSRTDTVNTFITSGTTYLRTEVIPDGGTLSLSKFTASLPGDLSSSISGFSVSQNFPNPFNPVTKINYYLPFDSNVRIAIYNSLGQYVKELANENQNFGNHELTFNGTGFSSGAYFYSIQASSPDGNQNFKEYKKMTLIK